MNAENLCEWIYTKGKRCGEKCNLLAIENKMYCKQHIKKVHAININKSEKDEKISLVSSLDIENINQEEIKESESICENQTSNNNCVDLSQLYVNDCIRNFFRQYKEDQELFSSIIPNNKSSDNMMNYLLMGGMAILPMLFKGMNLSQNLSQNSNNNAISKQARFNEIQQNGFSCPNTNRQTGNDQKDITRPYANENNQEGKATIVI